MFNRAVTLKCRWHWKSRAQAMAERLRTFLTIGKDVIGSIGGGKRKSTGQIDIAVMQSLSRKGEISDLVEGYGQIIVDECHHVSAFSFEAILKRARAKYVLGLTATPIRRDGQQPIIFMQCGPIRHKAAKAGGAPRALEVIPRFLTTAIDLPQAAGIQDVFRRLAEDPARSQAIATDIIEAIRQRLGTWARSACILHNRSKKPEDKTEVSWKPEVIRGCSWELSGSPFNLNNLTF